MTLLEALTQTSGERFRPVGTKDWMYAAAVWTDDQYQSAPYWWNYAEPVIVTTNLLTADYEVEEL